MESRARRIDGEIEMRGELRAGQTEPDSAAPRAVGLSSVEAATRLAIDGPNALPAARRAAAWKLLLSQLTHLFAVMLWLAAGLAFVAGLVPWWRSMPSRWMSRC